VAVVKASDARLGQNLTRLVQCGGGGASLFRVEGTLVRNPGRADIFQSQRLGFSGNRLGFLRQTLIGDVSAHGIEPGGDQHLPQRFGGLVVEAGQLNILDAKLGGLLNPLGQALGEDASKAVQLEADGPLEAGTGAGGQG
jgi:hypothetical protein